MTLPIDRTTVGARIRARRLALGIGQRELASLIGIIGRALYGIEAAKRATPGTARVETLYAIARALGTRMEILLGLPDLEHAPAPAGCCALLRHVLREDPPARREEAIRLLAEAGADPNDPKQVLEAWPSVRRQLDKESA